MEFLMDESSQCRSGGGASEDDRPHLPVSGLRFVNLATGLWPDLLSRFFATLPPIESRVNALGQSLIDEVTESTHSFHAGIVFPSEGGLIGLLGGYCVLDEVEIHTFFLHPLWRNRGAGSSMLQRFLTGCRFSGISAVHLEVRSRSPARGLYDRLGFKESGVRKGYYGPEWSQDGQSDDAIVMVYTIAKTIDPPNPGEKLMAHLTGAAG
jgi:ribosomal-protein-alanine N-acetyltransferase